jgi:hypothetical protein
VPPWSSQVWSAVQQLTILPAQQVWTALQQMPSMPPWLPMRQHDWPASQQKPDPPPQPTRPGGQQVTLLQI